MKLPFEYVERHIEEMSISHDDLIISGDDLVDEVELDKQCELISAFIIACGWTEDEFWNLKYGNEILLNQEELNKLN